MLIDWEVKIEEAAARISGYVANTPIVASSRLSAVYFKCEQFQPMGAFKIRGAANALLESRHREKLAGAVTYSTGNHGLAVAYMGRQLGVSVTVCLSTHVPQAKIGALRQLGARLEIHGESQDDAYIRARRIAEEEDMVLIDPFDDPAIIAGQGTIGLEILDQVQDVDTVLVPLSGGGLAAGVAAIIKARKPQCRVMGISMDRSPVMYESLRQGHPICLPEMETLADSLQGGIGLANQHTFAMVQALIDEVVLVSEEEIRMAMGYLAVQEGLLVEGAAAVSVAYLLRQTDVRRAGKIVAILTGRNGDADVVCKIMQSF